MIITAKDGFIGCLASFNQSFIVSDDRIICMCAHSYQLFMEFYKSMHCMLSFLKLVYA